MTAVLIVCAVAVAGMALLLYLTQRHAQEAMGQVRETLERELDFRRRELARALDALQPGPAPADTAEPSVAEVDAEWLKRPDSLVSGEFTGDEEQLPDAGWGSTPNQEPET